MWNEATGPPPTSVITIPPGTAGVADDVALSSDGHLLAVTSAHSQVQTWNLTTGQAGRPIDLSSFGTAFWIALSQNGATMAIVNSTDHVQLRNTASGAVTAAHTSGLPSGVASVAISGNGKTVAFGGYGIAELWNVTTDTLRQFPLPGQSGGTESIAFAPDGTVLATGTLSGNVQLWDVATGEPIGAALPTAEGEVTALAFSPDGKTLAARPPSGLATCPADPPTRPSAPDHELAGRAAHAGQPRRPHRYALLLAQDARREARMDAVGLVLTALSAGAGAGVKDVAGSAVQDAYGALKAVVRRRLAGREAGEMVLARYEQAPQAWEAPLADELSAAGAGTDRDLLTAAQALLGLLDAAGARAGKYEVNVTGSQGVQIGDGNTQHNTFGAPPGR
jgi:RIP homotypic interaction motif/WD domain, G-beta repeat